MTNGIKNDDPLQYAIDMIQQSANERAKIRAERDEYKKMYQELRGIMSSTSKICRRYGYDGSIPLDNWLSNILESTRKTDVDVSIVAEKLRLALLTVDQKFGDIIRDLDR